MEPAFLVKLRLTVTELSHSGCWMMFCITPAQACPEQRSLLLGEATQPSPPKQGTEKHCCKIAIHYAGMRFQKLLWRLVQS